MNILTICVILFIMFLYLEQKEDFWVWIPKRRRRRRKIRNTRNMIYDLRGHPLKFSIDGKPIFLNNKGYPGPFPLKLYPYFHMSPHYHTDVLDY